MLSALPLRVRGREEERGGERERERERVYLEEKWVAALPTAAGTCRFLFLGVSVLPLGGDIRDWLELRGGGTRDTYAS